MNDRNDAPEHDTNWRMLYQSEDEARARQAFESMKDAKKEPVLKYIEMSLEGSRAPDTRPADEARTAFMSTSHARRPRDGSGYFLTHEQWNGALLASGHRVADSHRTPWSWYVKFRAKPKDVGADAAPQDSLHKMRLTHYNSDGQEVEGP